MTEEQKARKREYYKRYRERNRERLSEYRRRYYEKHRERVREYHNRLEARTGDKRNRLRAIRQWLLEVKATVGCVDCGLRDPRVLDFDHIDGDKVMNVAKANSRRLAEREMAKCEVRCANCHRIKTCERREKPVVRTSDPPLNDWLAQQFGLENNNAAA